MIVREKLIHELGLLLISNLELATALERAKEEIISLQTQLRSFRDVALINKKMNASSLLQEQNA